MQNLFVSYLALAVSLVPIACSSSSDDDGPGSTSSSSASSGGSAGSGGTGGGDTGGAGGGGGAEPTWTQLGLDGDRVYFLAVLKTSPATVFAGTTQGSTDAGTFRTTDGGDTWPLTPGLEPDWPTGLAVAPMDDITLVDVGVEGIFRSIDGGATWAQTNYAGNSYGIVFDPGSANVWLADDLRVWRSVDSGLTWAVTPNTGLPTGMKSVQLPAFDGNKLYVAVGTEGVYASSDNGDSFQPANAGLPIGMDFADVIGISAHVSRPGVVFAQTNGQGLYRTDDGGGSWSHVDTGSENTKYGALLMDPSNPTTIYVSHDDTGLLRSTDDGATWTVIGPESVSVISVDIDPVSGDVYAGTLGGGVWRFGD